MNFYIYKKTKTVFYFALEEFEFMLSALFKRNIGFFQAVSGAYYYRCAFMIDLIVTFENKTYFLIFCIIIVVIQE